MEYGHNMKRIVFEELDKRHADLRIRLHADGINQGEFFRSLISGYIDRDERIVGFIEDYRENNDIQSKQKRLKSKKMYQLAGETENKFALGKEEIDDIFDLLEKENKDL